MPIVGTAYAKNMVRRALRELVDPSPNRNDCARIWHHFGSRCAYCGRRLDKSKKEGHIDHLISASKGGPNHVSNRVLSCWRCNEAEKLDADWRDFLRQKVRNTEIRNRRIKKIRLWQKQNPLPVTASDAQMLNLAASCASDVIELFDRKVTIIKKETTKRTGAR